LLYPIKFSPVLNKKVWGGDRLKNKFNKDIKEDNPIGESWELSSRKERISIVINGEFKNKSLIDLIRQNRREVFGLGSEKWGHEFPLLIKFLDINERLSVQVHPDDNYAMKYEKSLGKTEIWYVIDAEESAKIIYGFKKGITKEKFINLIKENNITSSLREIKVKKGDIIYIPAGILHAARGGILIAEIQKSSDITYRIYDWDRLGLNGKPRELHLKKALDVINFNNYKVNPRINNKSIKRNGYKILNYIKSEYFNVEIIKIERHYKRNMNGKCFEVLVCIEGKFEIIYNNNKDIILKGETVLIPACLGIFLIKGKAKIIRVRP
jgi:mannose-6-phosphate isomerase